MRSDDMTEEKYVIQQDEISLNVVQGEVTAVRTKDIQRTAYRIYRDGKIGVAGSLGKPKKDELLAKARKALELNISYDGTPGSGRSESKEDRADIEDHGVFASEMEVMLAELRKSQPDFSFSNKINLNIDTYKIENSDGLDLSSRIGRIGVGLVIKEKKSSNIMDAFSIYEGQRWDRKEYLRLTNQICNAFQNQLELESGNYPVVFIRDDMAYQLKLIESLNGLLFGSGGSIYSGKLGEKIFDTAVTIYQSRNAADGVLMPFFDMEGTLNPDDRFPLVENGVLRAAYTNKNYAARYKLPLTGAAGGEYDSIPDLIRPPLVTASSGKTMEELLDGRKAVFVLIASGGDFTPEGHFASPVQLSFLFDGKKLIGRLPELTISSHMKHMFGKDYIGVSSDSLSSMAPMLTIAMKMKVTVK
jgi:PmbA protein